MIRRAKRDGREARGNEVRERIEKSCHCFFKRQVAAQTSKFKLIECIIKTKCHGVMQNAKIFAIGEQNVANEN